MKKRAVFLWLFGVRLRELGERKGKKFLEELQALEDKIRERIN